MTGTDHDTPAPPPTTHGDDRELGYGAADARPDIGDSEAAPGALQPPSGESDGEHDGQSEQGYSGGPNPNATSTKGASHDRAS